MRVFLGVIGVTSALVLAGCEAMITGGDLIRPGEPTGLIEVVNNSDTILDVVLISNCDASTYGLNRLPEGTWIPFGESYAFEVSAGCWDVDAGSAGVGEARQRMSVAANGVTRYTIN